jgi:proline dehydrogenase
MLARDFILWLSTKPSVTNTIARRGMKNGFARRFIAGETLEEVLTACAALCAQGRTVSLNHLGENVSTEAAANKVFETYVHLLERLHDRKLPGNISIKLTQLGLAVGREFCENLAQNIARQASELDRTIEIDMEGSAYTDVTLDIFEAVQRASANAALAIQAYLYRSENDLKRLEPLRPKIRLVKGAYREPKNIAFQEKSAVDANFKRLTTQLMEGAARGTFFPAIGSHDPAMAAYAQAEAARLHVPQDKYEFQMLYGIRRDLQDQVFREGNPVQVYVSFGTDWCPWFMRRLAERPANCWFVLRSLLAERKA